MTLLSDAEQLEKRAYSVREFCAAFSICPASVYNEINAGHLRKVKFKGKTLILKEDADLWVENRLKPTPVRSANMGRDTGMRICG